MTGQEAFLAGHCPLTGRYFEPCVEIISLGKAGNTRDRNTRMYSVTEKSR